MPERYAIFYAPDRESPLWSRAAQWLGRDAAGGSVLDIDVPGMDTSQRLKQTQSARRYGFHATLKPPMALPAHQTVLELESALASIELRPVAIGPLEVRNLDGFAALMPERQSEALTEFAADVVRAFESFRAPPTLDERNKRLSTGLTARQRELLDRYGYPYVMEEFRFHMTIGDRLDEPDREALFGAARDWFAPVLEEALFLDRLVLFHEPEPGANFVRLADFPLGPSR